MTVKKPFIGKLMQFPSVELTEMFAYTGFDFLNMDMEHGLIENNDALAMVRACEIYDTAAMIRVPQVDEEKIKKSFRHGSQRYSCGKGSTHMRMRLML